MPQDKIASASDGNKGWADVNLEANLAEVSRLLNTVLDAIPDVIGVQDPHHRIIRYNKAGYAFLGMAPEQTHGKKCHELIGHALPCLLYTSDAADE